MLDKFVWHKVSIVCTHGYNLVLFRTSLVALLQKRDQEATSLQVSRKEVEKREKERQEEMKRELEKVKKRRIVSAPPPLSPAAYTSVTVGVSCY